MRKPSHQLEIPADKNELRLTHARHDPAHCTIPGMFRAIDKHGGRKARVELVHELNADCRIEVKMFEPLGADDLRVLQGLIAMAAYQRGCETGAVKVGPEPTTTTGRKLRSLLELQHDAVDMDACLVQCSFHDFAREIGYANPRNAEQIKACIERLFLVTFFVQEGRRRMGFRLLSRSCGTDDRGMTVVLNPRLASAIMGGHHVRISMDEVRALEGDAERLIHQRICAWARPGSTESVGLQKLLSYLWPDQSEITPGAARKRRWIVRQAMGALGRLPGWGISPNSAGDMFSVTRPAVPCKKSKR